MQTYTILSTITVQFKGLFDHSTMMISILMCLALACVTFLGCAEAFMVHPSTTLTTRLSSSVFTTTAANVLPVITTTTSLFGKKEARAEGNERKNKTERVKKVKDDVIEVGAVVLESLPNAMFRCAIDGAAETQDPVLATISGKIRKNFVKILVGDKVTIELSPYDLTRGRITYRYR